MDREKKIYVFADFEPYEVKLTAEKIIPKQLFGTRKDTKFS